MRREIGVNTWVWCSPLTDERLVDLAPRISAWGFDGIEVPVEAPGDWDPDAAAALFEDLGLTASVVLVMGEGRELVGADAATVSRTQDYLRHVVDVAATVGSPTIAGPAYASVGRTWRMTDDERRRHEDELREGLTPVVDHARAAGVTVAVEPLNRYETSLFNTVEQTLRAIEGLPEDGCGLALDLYHCNIEEASIMGALERAGDRIAHVQVCDNDRGAPGAGHLDWPEILATLDRVGYEGPLMIESFTGDNATIATAASIWRPLAPSQDDLARDGLAYLRELQGGPAERRETARD